MMIVFLALNLVFFLSSQSQGWSSDYWWKGNSHKEATSYTCFKVVLADSYLLIRDGDSCEDERSQN